MAVATDNANFLLGCAETLVARESRRRAYASRRAAELQTRAQVAASRLVDEKIASAVWLFGSLVWGEAHAGSDVDLLAEGLALENWSRAVAIVEQNVSAPVDLLRVEEALPGLVERVHSQGRRLA